MSYNEQLQRIVKKYEDAGKSSSGHQVGPRGQPGMGRGGPITGTPPRELTCAKAGVAPTKFPTSRFYRNLREA